MASVSIEDFLKGVFMLISLDGKASTGRLAQRLSVSNAAITDMSRKLAKQELINYEKYRNITLTPTGERMALDIIRRHRLWELFLNKVLNIPWEKVHDEAERLEHQTSEYLIDELEKFLGYPRVDPHGEAIPDREGNFTDSEYECLTNIDSPAKVRLKRIVEHTESTILFLNELNIALDQDFYVKEKKSDTGQVMITLNGLDSSIPLDIAAKLYVEIVT
jgi:DtxR family transcriptional regulator, Mn-dependent transcriptional regulator